MVEKNSIPSNDDRIARSTSRFACEDYDNDPTVIYHALDLPRCANPATIRRNGRWMCNTHARLSTLLEAVDRV